MLAAFTRLSPPQPLLAFIRSAGDRLRPPRPVPYLSAETRARDEALGSGRAAGRQLAALLFERDRGGLPTIVLGGFVPDSTEQVHLLRGFLLRKGSVYYFNYPRGGFSLDLLCAQLDDLVADLASRGRRPVILSVSFGCGIVLEWLRRARDEGRAPDAAGLVFVSPVACAADVLEEGAGKPSTLLGRALKPYLGADAAGDPAIVEKSRAIFMRMFEAGAQNKASLRALMGHGELRRLRAAVFRAIREIDATGAHERVRSLMEMAPMTSWPAAGEAPLSPAPTLILYAEKEGAVIAAGSPTRIALESSRQALFPNSEIRIVSGGETPVQHASLIFHYFQFLPHLTAFYRLLKTGKLRLAA
jgi:hypothetical protein